MAVFATSAHVLFRETDQTLIQSSRCILSDSVVHFKQEEIQFYHEELTFRDISTFLLNLGLNVFFFFSANARLGSKSSRGVNFRVLIITTTKKVCIAASRGGDKYC